MYAHLRQGGATQCGALRLRGPQGALPRMRMWIRIRIRMSDASMSGIALSFVLCVAAVIAMFCPAPAVAGPRELRASDGQLYADQVRLSATTLPADRYETVTGRLLMDGGLAGPALLFSDVDGLPGWISNLAAAEQIGVRAPTDRSIYMRFSAPLGFADRDGLMRFLASKESARTIVLSFEDIAAYPLRPHAVRMTQVRGRFRVEQVSAGRLAVEFRLHYDSAARPVALVNVGVRQQVEQTLLRMRRHIEAARRRAPDEAATLRSLGLD